MQWGYKLFDSVYSHNRKLLANIQAPVLDDAVVERLLVLLKDQGALRRLSHPHATAGECERAAQEQPAG